MKPCVKEFLALYCDDEADSFAFSSYLDAHHDAVRPILEFLSSALPTMPAELPSDLGAQKKLVLEAMDAFEDNHLEGVARNFSGFAADLGGQSESGRGTLDKGNVRKVWTDSYGNFKDIKEAPENFISIRNVNRAIQRATSAKNNLQITLFLADELINNPKVEIEINGRDVPIDKLVGLYKRRSNYGIFCHPELTSYICEKLNIAPLLPEEKRPYFHARKGFDKKVLHRGYVDPKDGKKQYQEIESLVNALLAGPDEIDIPLDGEKVRIKVADYAGYFRVAGSTKAVPMLHEDLRELAEERLGILRQPTAEYKKTHIPISDLTKQLYRSMRYQAERSKALREFIKDAGDEVVDPKSGLTAKESITHFRSSGRTVYFVDRRAIEWLQYNYVGVRPEEGKEFWKTGDPLMRELCVKSSTSNRQIMQEILHDLRKERRDEVLTTKEGEDIHFGDAIRRFNSTSGLVYYVDVRHLGALAEKGVNLVRMLHERALETGAMKLTANNRHLFEQSGAISMRG